LSWRNVRSQFVSRVSYLPNLERLFITSPIKDISAFADLTRLTRLHQFSLFNSLDDTGFLSFELASYAGQLRHLTRLNCTLESLDPDLVPREYCCSNVLTKIPRLQHLICSPISNKILECAAECPNLLALACYDGDDPLENEQIRVPTYAKLTQLKFINTYRKFNMGEISAITSLISLELHEADSVDDWSCLGLLTNLNELVISIRRIDVRPRLFSYLSTLQRSLTSLGINAVGSQSELESIISLTNLQSLSLNYYRSNAVTPFTALLKLKHFTVITSWNVLSSDFEHFTQLETFHVNANNLATQDVRWISRMTNLNRLNLTSASLEDKWIAPLTKLTKLNVYAPYATKMEEQRLINTICGSLTRLEILHLVDFSHLGASTIDPLTTLSHLRMLTICTKRLKNPMHLMSLTSLVSLVYFKYRNTDEDADDQEPPANIDQTLRALRGRSPFAIRYQVAPGNDVRVY
jgi:hypothetical protein